MSAVPSSRDQPLHYRGNCACVALLYTRVPISCHRSISERVSVSPHSGRDLEGNFAGLLFSRLGPEK
ncbi:hypothetical protein J6590_021486 [Homalodisca vitripennis]|nr:hypothetical protein J6590_021486 [Homalodisca vitripennis]